MWSHGRACFGTGLASKGRVVEPSHLRRQIHGRVVRLMCLGLFVCVTAGLAACGGDDETAATTTTTSRTFADVQIEFIERPKEAVKLPERSEVSLRPYRIQRDGSVVAEHRGPLAAEAAKMWDIGASVPVKFLGGSAELRSRVRAVADEWSKYANVRFAWVPNDHSAVIRVSFEQDGASWSYVGRDALGLFPFQGLATMNLGWLTDDSPDTEVQRVVLHEFGHALRARS